MSSVRTPPVPPVISGTAVSKDETRSFMAVFPDVVRDLTDTGRNLDIPDVTKWFAKVWIILSSILFVYY
jgi:farnesyl diphosphate synthase